MTTATTHDRATPAQVPKIDITRAMTLLDVTRHEWPGRYQLSFLKNIAEEGGAPLGRSHVKPPPGDFIPEALRNLIAVAWRRVNCAVDKWTRPFGMADLRIMETANLEPFFVEMRPARAGVDELVATLKARYGEIVRHNRTFWVAEIGQEGYDKLIAPKILARHRLEERFRLEIGLRQWEDVRRIRVSTAIQAEVDQAVRSTQARIDRAIEDLLVGPRQQLAAALTSLQELLGRNGRITAGSFTAVRDAIQQCRAFSQCVDPTLLARAEELSTIVERAIGDAEAQAAADRRVSMASVLTSYGPTLMQAARQVVDAANDAAAIQQVQRQFAPRSRGIDIGD